MGTDKKKVPENQLVDEEENPDKFENVPDDQGEAGGEAEIGEDDLRDFGDLGEMYGDIPDLEEDRD